MDECLHTTYTPRVSVPAPSSSTATATTLPAPPPLPSSVTTQSVAQEVVKSLLPMLQSMQSGIDELKAMLENRPAQPQVQPLSAPQGMITTSFEVLLIDLQTIKIMKTPRILKMIKLANTLMGWILVSSHYFTFRFFLLITITQRIFTTTQLLHPLNHLHLQLLSPLHLVPATLSLSGQTKLLAVSPAIIFQIQAAIH